MSFNIAHGLDLFGRIEERKEMGFALTESMFGADRAAECNGHSCEVDHQLIRERDASWHRVGSRFTCRWASPMCPKITYCLGKDSFAAFSIIVQNYFIAIDRNGEVGAELLKSVLANQPVHLFGKCMAKNAEAFAI